MFLFYLLFEEFTSDFELVRVTVKNIRPFDYLERIYLLPEEQSKGQDSSDSEVSNAGVSGRLAEYFDLNRMMKFEEKFENEQVLEIFQNVVGQLIET